MDDQHRTDNGKRSDEAAVPAHPSVLDSVVVYAAGAVCRRRARVALPPGGRLRLTGLPQVLDGRSLRARVLSGPPGTAVTEARLEPVAELRSPDELPSLRRQLKDAREHESAVRERHRRTLDAIAETSALRAVPPARRKDEPLRRTPADAWLELAEFVDERLARLQLRAEELTEELERAEHATETLTDRVERSSTAGPTRPVETSATVLLTLTRPVAGPGPAQAQDQAQDQNAAPATEPGTGTEIDIELEYGVPAARWVPAYRLSYQQGSDTGRLVLRASVAQRTGEDWTGVRLALSTADLDRRTDLPKLRSLRIGRSQPAPPPSGWREPPAGLGDLFTGFDAVGPRPEPRRRGPVPVAAVTAAAPPRFAAPVAPTAPGAPYAGGARPSGPHPGGPHPGGTRSADEPPLPSLGFAGYGGPPPQPGGPLPPPAAAPAPAPLARRARSARGATEAAGSAFADEFGGAAAPLAPPAPATPDATLLDYPSLVLAGPDEPTALRGTLHPPTATRPAPAGSPLTGLQLPLHAVPPRASAGSFDHRFDAAAPADVPSDGSWHTVTIGEIPVTVQPEYVTVPAVEEKVYGTLVLANRTAQAVLAGPVEVTVDDEFLLTAALPTLAPGGTRRLGIGVTESVEVARRTELHESTTGMLNTSTVLDHRVHVELANRLGHAVTVEVRERVPVSSDSEVRIEERADWHAPAVPSPECPPSTRLWRIELPPGGRAELDGGYQIRIPAGKAIVGGNRRN
ncbi:DUF4139 domain-containing protein [Kitasatospora sp. NPDC091207]|uniref:DUF4139 domain-containing protein n=1 Tax=Kitasatospora sp. NPDC091207 TaxID=3364083 RepID=UPI003827F2BE